MFDAYTSLYSVGNEQMSSFASIYTIVDTRLSTYGAFKRVDVDTLESVCMWNGYAWHPSTHPCYFSPPVSHLAGRLFVALHRTSNVGITRSATKTSYRCWSLRTRYAIAIRFCSRDLVDEIFRASIFSYLQPNRSRVRSIFTSII